MIKGKDIYDVLSALVPLYVAMALGFGSVRWWKIFTPEQCFGINRFVAVFAVPFLSFNFISSNNIYAMNYKFLAGDSLQKVVILFFLFLWNMTRFGSFDWSITLFSLFTLPNTLVMGIPLLKSMYGESSSSLMVQIVFLQTCIWTTMLLAMFEYRGAKILIREQFPEAALASISSLKADSDVNSLSGRDPIQADAEIGQDGKIHVVFRRSNSTLSTISNHSINNRSQNHNTNNNSSFPSSIITPRASSLSGVEIYSVHSSRDPTPRNSNFSNQIDNSSNIQRSSSQNGMILGSVGASRALLSGSASIGSQRRRDGGSALHMFVWSPSASPITEMNMMRHHSMNRGGSVSEIVGTIDSSKVVEVPHETNASKDEEKSIEIEEKATYPLSRSMKKVNTEEEGNNGEREAQMPSAGVFTRLVLMMVWRKLIRNPNTWASLLGLTWSLIAFRYNITMPAIVKGSFTIVSNTGMGMAMFSLGLFMALQPKVIACGKKWAIISMAIRFLGGPAVIAACSAAIGIRGVLLQVEIIQAALPQAIIPFVFAKEYNLHADIFSTAVIFGMVVALPVTIIYYALLGL